MNLSVPPFQQVQSHSWPRVLAHPDTPQGSLNIGIEAGDVMPSALCQAGNQNCPDLRNICGYDRLNFDHTEPFQIGAQQGKTAIFSLNA